MRIAIKMRSSVYLARLYLTAWPRIAYRTTASFLLDPKGSMDFLHQVLSAQDLESDDPVLGSIEIFDLLDADDPEVIIPGTYYRKRSSDTRLLTELSCLAYIMKALRPKTVFEIGTFIGRTTRLLAANCPLESKIYTLDLERDKVRHEVGSSFAGTPEQGKIRQLHGDSRNFDYSPWNGACDFVWVDGCHDYEYVINDAEKAFALCRPGGWIAFHDYRHTKPWDDVGRAIHKLNRKHPMHHIRATTIAICRKLVQAAG